MKAAKILATGTALGLIALAGAPAHAQTLRVAIQEDPDMLDPARGTTYGGRVVFAAMCDKLVDISPDLELTPMLATAWEWSDGNTAITFTLREGVTFHDGTPFDAEAVKFNIERAKTLPESARRAELASIETVEVVDPLTVRFNLSFPDIPLLVALSDRAGMMISPEAGDALGADFGTDPVCSGPFVFAERQQRDFIRLTRFDGYWNADEIHYDEVIYTYIEDSSVRLSRLRAGDIDIAERVAASDIPTIEADPALSLLSVAGLGTTHLHVGTHDTPLTRHPEVREAFELAIDRNIINQAAHDGQYIPDNQLIPTSSPYHVAEAPMPARDVEAARALLESVGDTPVPVEITFANTLTDTRVGQVIQSLANEAGFAVSLLPLEGATAIDRYIAGDFEMFIGNWSGRGDPDANVSIFVTCEGSQNWAGYCNPALDEILLAARQESDFDTRYELYRQATEIITAERPTIPLYHPQWLFGVRNAVEGLVLYPDGLLRLTGVRPAG